MKLAITGKGGVGKTTIAGTLARVLAQHNQRVLAIDVDSNPNLALSLGLGQVASSNVVTVPQQLAEWRTADDGKAYVHLREPLATVIDRYSTLTPDGAQLLVMGTVDQAGIGCRCDPHAVARGITGHLVAEADVAILDMEAGLEHLSRGTTEHVDILLIIAEPYYRALEAATRIRDLADQLGLPRVVVVANRVRSAADSVAIQAYCSKHQLELVATVPFDSAIQDAEQQDRAPIDYAPDSPAMQAIRDLALRLPDLISATTA